MKTFKLKIKNGIEVNEWCLNYSFMFRKLYCNFDLSEDKGFLKQLRDKYKLDSWFMQSCKMEVKTKVEQEITRNKQNAASITQIEKELSTEEFIGIKGKRKKYNLIKKLKYLKKNTDKPIVFGTKAILRRISYLPNEIKALQKAHKREKDKKNKKLTLQQITTAKEQLKQAKKQYTDNRVLGITSIGEAPQRSNRKYTFDFVNKKVIFKPNKATKISVEFACGKAQYKQLCKLQQNVGQQPITVGLNNDYIYITFDEEKLAGYAFNEHEYFKELKQIPKEDKVQRKKCYVKWINEQKQRKEEGKNPLRYLSIDENPEYIGFTILEKVGKKNMKIVHKECIHFKTLNTKLKLSSIDPIQKKQNNKRTHELYEAYKYIFMLSMHYRVAHCVIEELNFKQDNVNENAKQANYKTKRIWQRERRTNAIKKYCNELGIQLIEVNTCYSSFIGNIKYPYFDSVNAAIEIGRRGITKYLKGGFYSSLERIDLDTMCLLGLDVQNNTVSTWIHAYKLFKTSELRYRRELPIGSLETNLLSHKSGTKLYNFL